MGDAPDKWQELTDLAGLLRGSAELARPALQKLDFQVRLYPIEQEGKRPYLKAVATATLEALRSELPLLSRSLEGAEVGTQFCPGFTAIAGDGALERVRSF
jgi:hypothetical protein